MTVKAIRIKEKRNITSLKKESLNEIYFLYTLNATHPPPPPGSEHTPKTHTYLHIHYTHIHTHTHTHTHTHL